MAYLSEDDMIRIKMRYIGYVIAVVSFILNFFINDWVKPYITGYVLDITMIVVAIAFLVTIIRNLTFKPLEPCDFRFDSKGNEIISFIAMSAFLLLIIVLLYLTKELVIVKISVIPIGFLGVHYSIRKKQSGIFGDQVMTDTVSFDISQLDDMESTEDGYRLDFSKPWFIFDRIYSVNVGVHDSKREAFEAIIKSRNVLRFSEIIKDDL